MPLNEIPKYFNPETRSLIEAALEDAWQELSKDGNIEATLAQKKLRATMVALASVGETDHRKLKWFAIHAWRGAMQAEQSAIAACPNERNGGHWNALKRLEHSRERHDEMTLTADQYFQISQGYAQAAADPYVSPERRARVRQQGGMV